MGGRRTGVARQKWLGKSHQLMVMGVLLTLTPVASLGHDNAGQDCLELRSDRDRLLCFDAAHGRTVGAAPAPLTREPRTPRRDRPTFPLPGTPEPKPEAPAVSEVPQRETSASEEAFGKKAEPVKPEPIKELNATIQSVRKRWPDDGRVYTLDNGQIWEQVETQVVSIVEGDQVRITRGRLGGYRMIDSDGASTRVKRKK